MKAMQIKISAGTDVGLVRKNNEDNFVICSSISENNWFMPQTNNGIVDIGDKGCLLVVADGMGGMNAGEIASAIAVDTIKSLFSNEKITDNIIKTDEAISKYINDAIIEADNNIKKEAEKDKEKQGMGSTIVLAWIINGKAYIGWCGDSRVYSYFSKSGLIQLTKDHSYVQELIDKGQLKPELAFDHPLNNMITRSLGDSEEKAKPDIIIHKLGDEEVILLCSDGLCGYCKDYEIENIILKNKEDITKLRANLINSALNAGGEDNVTVALCKTMSGFGDYEPIVDNVKQKPKKKKTFAFIFALMLLITISGFVYYYTIYNHKDKTNNIGKKAPNKKGTKSIIQKNANKKVPNNIKNNKIESKKDSNSKKTRKPSIIKRDNVSKNDDQNSYKPTPIKKDNKTSEEDKGKSPTPIKKKV
jgi:PPM family protein phosphatase